MKYLQLLSIVCALLLTVSCSKVDKESLPANGKSGSITKFAVVGKYMYSLNSSHLDVYDITVPAMPVRVNSIGVARVVETVFSYGDHLYIGAPDGVYIVDITVPDKPFVKGSETHWVGCDPVVVKGTIAYSTIRSGSQCGGTVRMDMLLVLDVRDPADPETLSSIAMVHPAGLGYDGNLLFVCDGPGGLKVFDISNPVKPELFQVIEDIQPVDVIADRGTLIVTDAQAFQFYDYSDPANIVLKYKIPRS